MKSYLAVTKALMLSLLLIVIAFLLNHYAADVSTIFGPILSGTGEHPIDVAVFQEQMIRPCLLEQATVFET